MRDRPWESGAVQDVAHPLAQVAITGRNVVGRELTKPVGKDDLAWVPQRKHKGWPCSHCSMALARRASLFLSHLGRLLIAVGLTSDEAQGCTALLAAADNLEDTPIPAETPSTDATGNLTGSSQRRELSGANPGSLLPEPDDVYLTHTATTREDLQTLAPAIPLTVADRLGEADTTLDHDLAEWQAGQGPRPRLSVLGPIYARVGTGGNPLAAAKRRAFYTELLAYLWSQPHGATTAQVTDALNITEERARRDLSKLREWLGTNPATGQPHLPQARKSQTGRLLGIGIYEVNDLLVDAVLRQGSCRISGFESDHTVGVWLTRE